MKNSIAISGKISSFDETKIIFSGFARFNYAKDFKTFGDSTPAEWEEFYDNLNVLLVGTL